jgi:hypothetical protein
MLSVHAGVFDNIFIPRLDLYAGMHRSGGVRLSFYRVYEIKLKETCGSRRMNEFMNMSVSFYQNAKVSPCDFSPLFKVIIEGGGIITM